jgi:hypothetical protein
MKGASVISRANYFAYFAIRTANPMRDFPDSFSRR